MTRSLHIRAGNRLLRLALLLALLVFLPAGTLRWWQGWVFVGVFWLCSAAVTVYLAINDPQLLERRINAGSRAEQVGSQKIIIRLVFLSFALTMIIPAIDHRFGWSQVPGHLVILGYALIVLGFAGIWIVFRENTYGASTIQLAEGTNVAAICWRLLDEERFLESGLTGYRDYLVRVRYRLVPFIW